jgi:hypothetical protein
LAEPTKSLTESPAGLQWVNWLTRPRLASDHDRLATQPYTSIFLLARKEFIEKMSLPGSLNHWSILELSNFTGTIPADAQFAFTPKICLGKHSTENSRSTVAR